MNEETKDALNDFIVRLIEKADKGTDLATEQIPLLCQDIILFGRVCSTGWAIFGFLLMCLGVCLLFQSMKLYETYRALDLEYEGLHIIHPDRNKLFSKKEDAFMALLLGATGTILSGFPGLIVFGENLSDAIKVWFAPRLYLLEYLKDFV